MRIHPADHTKQKVRPLSREIREHDAQEATLIRKSMAKWEDLDAVGRLLGRGLGRKELLDRVAKEVGTGLRQVQSALRPF